MSANLIRIEYSTMKGIETSYKNASKITNEIMKELNKIKSLYESHYKGKASDAISDGLPETLAHLKLLMDCYSKTAEYVNYTYEFSAQSDKALKKSLASI